MKKLLFLALSLLLLANTYSLAKRSSPSDSKAVSLEQNEEKKKIKKEELPSDAIKTLEGDAFKGWTIANTYKLKNGEYEIELKKGETKQSIKFDKDGKVK